MRWFINYIRSCFCAHEWEMIFSVGVRCDDGEIYTCKTYRCTKCGYAKRYKSHS